MQALIKEVVYASFKGKVLIPSYLVRACSPQNLIPLFDDFAHDLKLLGIDECSEYKNDLIELLNENISITISPLHGEDQASLFLNNLRNDLRMLVGLIRKKHMHKLTVERQLMIPRGMMVPTIPMTDDFKKIEREFSRSKMKTETGEKCEKCEYAKTADRGIIDQSDSEDHGLSTQQIKLAFEMKTSGFNSLPPSEQYRNKLLKLDELTKHAWV